MKKNLLTIAWAAVLAAVPALLSAQLQDVARFNLQHPCESFMNAQSFFVYSHDNVLYNYRSVTLLDAAGDLQQALINPTGSSVAALYKGKTYFDIASARDANDILYVVRDKRKGLPGKPVPVTAAYTPDARELLVGNALGEILVYSTSDYSLLKTMTPGKVYSSLSVSPNLYYVVGGEGNTVDVWNKETSALRKSLEMPGAVRSVSFSADSRVMAVAWQGGVSFVDVMSMNVTATAAEGQDVTDGCFHPEGKYFAYISDGYRLTVYNVKNHSIERSAELDSDGNVLNGARHTSFLTNADGTVSLVSNTSNAILIWDVAFLSPFYGSLFSSDLDAGMDNWMKQASGEDLNDYRIRVADENAAIQKAMLLEELATKVGLETVKFDDPFVAEAYDAANHSIEVTFEGANAIQLELPESEVENLRNGQITFSETKFTINDQDELVFSYLVATNAATGAKYIYDNRQYVKMQDMFGENDADYVPVSIRQTASEQMEALVVQTEAIAEESRTQNLITGKTEISVDSQVKADFDADGNKIFNYKVNYRYDVSTGFSAQEDFGPGKYRVEESNAALTMLKAIETAFNTELVSYLDVCSQVDVTITGTADSKAVRQIPYADIYGAFNNEPYLKKGILSSMTVSAKTYITNNEQLAFIRAVSAQNWMSNNIPAIKDNPAKFRFNYATEVAETEGSEYRRIVVNIVLKDAFKK